LLGFGTWTAFGAGRVMVGLDAGDASFDTAEETGGSKNAVVVSHTHTATDAGHTHTGVAKVQQTFGYGGGGSVYGAVFQSNQTSDSGTASISVSTEGSSGTNANLQPYIVVYMWKRTA
jgi:hypothetical protein